MPQPERGVGALETALDILQTFSLEQKSPSTEKLAKLRALAEGHAEKSLPADELASLIVHRELARRTKSSLTPP